MERQPIRGQEALLNSVSVYPVIIPGINGGGPNLMYWRANFQAYIPSSGSSRYAYNKAVPAALRYTHMANEIVQRAHEANKPVRAVFYSLGNTEVGQLSRSLVDTRSLPENSLDIICISPPGLGHQKLGGLLGIAGRFTEMIRSTGIYDHQYIFPTSGKQNFAQDTIFERWMFELGMNYRERLMMTAHIREIDTQSHINPKQRFAKLRKVLDKIRMGQHIPKEIHTEIQEKYHESSKDLVPFFSAIAQQLAFAAKATQLMHRGIEGSFLEAYQYAKEHGVDIKMGFVIFDKDPLAKLEDYARLEKLAQERGVDIHKYILEGEEHESLIFKPELMHSILHMKLE